MKISKAKHITKRGTVKSNPRTGGINLLRLKWRPEGMHLSRKNKSSPSELYFDARVDDEIDEVTIFYDKQSRTIEVNEAIYSLGGETQDFNRVATEERVNSMEDVEKLLKELVKDGAFQFY